MSLLPQGASFEELVQDCFLAYRGGGLMLSPLDQELLAEWAAQNVPLEVVARGIRIAAEKATWDAAEVESALKSLRQCRKTVDAEIKKYKRSATGVGEESRKSAVSPQLRWHKKLRKTLEATADVRLHPTIDSLLKTLLAKVPEDFSQLDALEDRVWAALFRRLPLSERKALLASVPTSLPSSASARKWARRFQRARALKQWLGVE